MKKVIKRVSTGIEGFDEILYGGFIPESTNLVRGGPGVGKTTFGLHFLMEGAKNNESVVYITLGEPESKIRTNKRKYNEKIVLSGSGSELDKRVRLPLSLKKTD